MWEKSYGVNASEQEKLAKKSELLVNQMDAQENKVLVLETQYKSIAEQYGEQHELSVQASNDLLKEQIAMADLNNQLIELQKTKAKIAEANIKANEDAKNAYDRYIYQNGASLREQGVSQDEIEIAASRVSGYNSSLSNSVNAVGSYFDNLMGKLSGKTSLLSDIPNLNYVADGGSSGDYNNNVYNNANTNKTEHIYNFAGANFEFKVDDTFNPKEFLRELKSVVKVNGG